MLRAAGTRLWLALAVAVAVSLLGSATGQGGTADSYLLLVSSSPDRSAPVALEARTVSGNVYVFSSPSTADIKRVRFWLDDTSMSGPPRQTENTAPYDFNGGTVSKANPFDTTKVADGSHTITAAIEFSDGSQSVVHAGFTIANTSTSPALAFDPSSLSLTAQEGGSSVSQTATLAASDGSSAAFSVSENAAWLTVAPTSGTTPAGLTFTADPAGLAAGSYSATVTAQATGYTSAGITVTFIVTAPSQYNLLVSTSANRSNPVALEGSTVSGNIYAFTSPDTSEIARVRFWLDNTSMSGNPYRTENTAPYDFNGGSVSTANPFDTTTLSDGQHTISARVEFSDGTTNALHGTFTVQNTAGKTLAFSPTSLNLVAAQGGTAASKTADLAAADGSAASFAVGEDAAWLAVTPTSGTTPATLTFTADPAGLGPGTYTETVTAQSAGYADGQITVSLEVRPPFDQVHLAWVGDPATTLTVVWRTWETTTSSLVEYRPTGTSTWLQASGAQRPSGTTGKLHEVTLSSLAPATEYDYRVRGDGSQWSPVFTARTAPDPGGALDFVYVADTGLIGRSDGLATGTAQVVDEIAKLDPLLVLGGGDYAYFNTDNRYGTLEATIDAWFNQVQPFAAGGPLMPTYGNHEILLGEGYAPWAARFPTPTGTGGADNRQNYSFDVGDVHFVSIMAVSDTGGLTSSVLTWIDQDLQAAKAAGKDWLVPFFHVPAFGDGTNHPGNSTLRAQLAPIFEKHGVKVAIASHDQSYERSYPLTNVTSSSYDITSTSKSCYTMADGVSWVKVSPGGKLSNVNGSFSSFATTPPPSWTAFRDNTMHHFARVAVSAGGTLRFEAFGVKGDGTAPVVQDSFEYRASCGSTPALDFDPSSLSLTTKQGGSSVSQTANLAAGDGGSAAFTITENAPWLTVAPTSGTTPTTLTFTADPTGLATGSYSETVTAQADGYTSASITVTLTVTSPGTLAFDPQSLTFSIGQGGDPQSQPAGLSTADSTAASFSITDDAAWLTVAPTSGTTPAQLTVTVNPTGLAIGTYTATVTAAASGFTDATLTVSLTITDTSPCTPISTLPCSEVMMPAPYQLVFDGTEGKLADGDGDGTGFTMVDPPTNGTGYLPAKVNVASGALALNTTAGIMYTTANSQDNALGIGVDAPDQVSILETTLRDPPGGTGRYEQAGLWLGNDQDNYVKLVVISWPGGGSRVQFLLELGGVEQKSVSQAISLPVTSLRLRLRANPADLSISGSFSINGGAFTAAGSATANGELFSSDAAGIDPELGTRTFGGVFATHRNASSALTYSFDDFSLTAEPISDPPPSAGFDFTRKSYGVKNPTAMAFGPDGRLYVTELFGKIHALTLDADKNVVADQQITTLGSRLTLGIAVDPASTASNVILWVAHSSPSLDAGEVNSSTITRLSGTGFATKQDVITGLPRALANHAVNEIHFGPDGKLYIAQGGNTGAGAPNTATTEFGDRPEQPLSAAFLVADVKSAGFEGACATPIGQFGVPSTCDVQVYSSGLRNMYDFVFHSNGSIYGPDNGLGVTGTYPPSPSPPCTGLADTSLHNPGEQPDLLVRLQPGRYYGHPNPYRDECVFKDGSLQGVAPLANYTQPIFNLGLRRSANGIIEYKGSAFGGALQGNLLIANYSQGDNIQRIVLSSDGLSVVSSTSLVDSLADPLPLVEGSDGTIYVGEFGASRVTALIPQKAVGTWESKAPLPEAILDAGGAALGGKLYVVAGKTSTTYRTGMYIYDPATDSWTAGPSLPSGYPGVEDIAVTEYNGKLYAFGGATAPFSGAVTNAAVFDPLVGAWTSIAPLPAVRTGAAVTVLNGKIYLLGGMDGSGASLSSVVVYDPVTNTWASGPAMSTRRDNPVAAALDGKIYVFGGRTRNSDGSEVNGTLASVEMLDPATLTWTSQAPMPTGRRRMALGLINGRAQLIGGERTPTGGAFSANEEYDASTNTWRTLAQLPTPRQGAAFGTINGFVHLAGGGTSGGSSFSSLNERFTYPAGQ